MASFADVIARLARLGQVEAEAAHALEERVAPEMLAHLQSLYGQQIPGQPDLAPSTQDERTRLGFPADEPLLRTGALRDAMHTWVDAEDGVNIGIQADDPLAVVAEAQEFGTATIPPRPRVGLVYLEDGHLAPDAVERVVAESV